MGAVPARVIGGEGLVVGQAELAEAGDEVLGADQLVRAAVRGEGLLVRGLAGALPVGGGGLVAGVREGGAVRDDAGVHDADHDALADLGRVCAGAGQALPDAALAAEAEDVRGGDGVQLADLVRHHGQDVRVRGQCFGLTAGEGAGEAVERGGVAGVDLVRGQAGALQGGVLLCGEVLRVLGRGRAGGVQFGGGAVGGLGGGQARQAAGVGGDRVLGHEDDVAAVLEGGGGRALGRGADDLADGLFGD